MIAIFSIFFALNACASISHEEREVEIDTQLDSNQHEAIDTKSFQQETPNIRKYNEEVLTFFNHYNEFSEEMDSKYNEMVSAIINHYYDFCEEMPNHVFKGVINAIVDVIRYLHANNADMIWETLDENLKTEVKINFRAVL